MRSSRVGWDQAECGRDLAERLLERLTANVKVTKVLDLIPASSDTVESEAADEIVLNKVKNKLIKNPKNLPKKGRKGI